MISQNSNNLNQFPKTEEKKEEMTLFKNIEDEDKAQKYPRIDSFLNSNFFTILINVTTIYALFGTDICLIATDKSADIIFDSLTLVALALFLIELILATIAKPNYAFSFFFWLDTISTVSLIFDLHMVSNILFFGASTNTASLAKAGKASRIGTK